MRFNTPLVQLALFASCTDAFYPFKPTWLEEIETGQVVETALDQVKDLTGGVAFKIEHRGSEV